MSSLFAQSMPLIHYCLTYIPKLFLNSIIALLSAPVNCRNYFIGREYESFLLLKMLRNSYMKLLYFAYVLGYVTTPLFYNAYTSVYVYTQKVATKSGTSENAWKIRVFALPSGKIKEKSYTFFL